MQALHSLQVYSEAGKETTGNKIHVRGVRSCVVRGTVLCVPAQRRLSNIECSALAVPRLSHSAASAAILYGRHWRLETWAIPCKRKPGNFSSLKSMVFVLELVSTVISICLCTDCADPLYAIQEDATSTTPGPLTLEDDVC
ncbi:hypothetical protein J6590_105852, partial [Homalodisca vitripennis]